MIDKVLCPYCGSEMVVITSIYLDSPGWVGRTLCPGKGCDALGPRVTGYKTKATAKEAALSAAQARYLPPNRPLTLDEVAQLETDDCGDTPCWTEEFRNKGRALAEYKSTNPDELIGYGRDFRVWLRKPTQEETDAAGWEDETNGNA